MNEVTLWKGDCLEEMNKIKDKSIDLILCDLPYGTTKLKWDIIIPFNKLWEQYDRIIKDNGVASLSCNRNFIGIELDDKYFEIAKDRIEKFQENIFDM